MEFVRGENSWAQTAVGDSQLEWIDLSVPFGIGKIVIEQDRIYRVRLGGGGVWLIRPTNDGVILDLLDGNVASSQIPAFIMGQDVRFTLEPRFVDGLPIGEELEVLMQNLHDPFILDGE